MTQATMILKTSKNLLKQIRDRRIAKWDVRTLLTRNDSKRLN